MEKAGEGIAKELIKKYGKNKRIGFFCGPGNNGGDGFAAARYLNKFNNDDLAEVYFLELPERIRTSESQKNWQLFQGNKFKNITAKDIPDHFDVVVDCFFGTGIQGKLREPYAGIVQKMNKLKGAKVTIDLPTPGFKEDFVISMMFPKSANAVVVDIGFPEEIKNKTGVGEVKILHKNSSTSHKGENGKLLIIGGSKRYHGAPLLAAKVASRIVDLVYFFSTSENNELVQNMKSELCEFIAVQEKELFQIVEKVDVILIGPGMDNEEDLAKSVGQLLLEFPNKKFVLDADAFQYLDKKFLNSNVVLTPHKEEFRKLFNTEPNKENVKKMAKLFNCIIALKGSIDYIASSEEFKNNFTGNSGMTKGGTGDVFAGLVGALACKNDLFLAASAALFINGLAGDRLQEKVGNYYNASDLIEEIPGVIKWCEDSKRKVDRDFPL